MKKITLISVLVVGAVFSTGCAGKFKYGNFENKMFSYYDSNNDGFVDQKEYLKVTQKRFEKLDDNNDLKVSKKELEECRFSNMMPNFSDNYLKSYDLDFDNLVEKSEMIKKAKEEFIKADTNMDKKLSTYEMKSFRVINRFESMDENKDGLISKDEYKNYKISK